MGREIAVVTGDFIASSKAPAEALGQAFEKLSVATSRMEAWHGAALRLTRYRGDGWQCVLARPGLAFRSCLYLLAMLRAGDAPLETRLAIGFGNMSRPGGETLADADGTAFHRSGRALEALSRGRRLGVASEGAPANFAAVLVLADAISRRWTVAQGEALCAMLAPDSPTQRAVAEGLGLTQQSISDRLDAAGYWALNDAMAILERA
jgi:hypothetical protein